MLQASSGAQVSELPQRPAVGPHDNLKVAGGAIALAVALGAYLTNLANSPPYTVLSLFDLRLYLAAGQVTRHAPATLYSWQYQPGFRFTYSPFAAVLFAGAGHLGWAVVAFAWTAATMLGLGLAIWFTIGALDWTGRRRLAAAMTLAAAAFWTEPVQRTLHLGQIDVLLMALVVWDLCQPDRRWWKGAGIGVAAGLKLVPLIFLLYLALTGRLRQAAVGLAALAATMAVGWAALPAASAQWWLHGEFLRTSRVGNIGNVANQSLLGLITRATGSLAAGTTWWLATAAVAGAAGIAVAVRCHRAGLPVHGYIACALTGLLISPVSWDHHWVWIAPVLAVLASGAVAATGRSWRRRAIRWLPVTVVAALFGAWPAAWPPPRQLPWGLIWTVPFTPGAVSHPWNSEYHWHPADWPVGSLYLLVGLACLACLAVWPSPRAAPDPARPA